MSRCCSVALAVLLIGLMPLVAIGQTNIQNADATISSPGPVFDDFIFDSAGAPPEYTGRLLVEGGAAQEGNITLNRNGNIVFQCTPEHDDAQLISSNTGDLYLNGHLLTIDKQEVAGEVPVAGLTFGHRSHQGGAIVGNGHILSTEAEVRLIRLGDSSTSNASIEAWSISIDQTPDAFLPKGNFKVYSHIILDTKQDYTKDFSTGDYGISFFANAWDGTDHEIRYTGSIDMPDTCHTYDLLGNDWRRGVALTVPAQLTGAQETLTYYFGVDTLDKVDSVAICGSKPDRDAPSKLIYATLQIDELDHLKNANGDFVNIGFSGGKLVLTQIAETTIDLRTANFGSFSYMDYPGKGVCVLKDGTTLKLSADKLQVDRGILELQGSNLTIQIDCQGGSVDPSSFGGFLLPADAKLEFINVSDGTIATGNLEGAGTVEGAGNDLEIGSDVDTDLPGAAPGESGFSGTINDVGTLTKVGSQDTTIASGAAVTADEGAVDQGELVVQQGASFSIGGGSGTLTVNDGGSLSGNGVVGANVVVNGGGWIKPGSSIGVETYNGNLTLNAGGIEVEIAGLGAGTTVGTPGIDNDLALVKGRFIVEDGGEISVTRDSGTLKAGDRYYVVVAEGGQQNAASLRVTDDLPGMAIRDFGIETGTRAAPLPATGSGSS